MGFEGQTNNMGEISLSKRRFRKVNEIHLKYVDDLSIAEAIIMSESSEQLKLRKDHSPMSFTPGLGMS